jgi:SAM-dependent methyltransferase
MQTTVHLLRKVRNKIRMPTPVFKLLTLGKEQFTCPICGYSGPFRDFASYGGLRKHAKCPKCIALERHRLQYVVVIEVLKGLDTREMKMLHFAPEEFFQPIFQQRFGGYETADLYMRGVDHQVDIQNLPFESASYDFIFASCVLEHIQDDRKAIQEIRRILKPNGIAMLPVPVVCTTTIEYTEANPGESGHWRVVGSDYFDRYREQFAKVNIYTSESFPERYQLFVYEDRSVWPNKDCPLRPPMPGNKHPDFVPVCYA